MAGAGYKLFNTGDVLTAAQVNTYLMEQTVMVFANAAARTTALSGVVSEGMISYLKDTNAVEVYDGSNWVSSDDPNAIQNTIVDAKGDLITATAADTPARLAVGSNGDTLVADSAASTGLRWQGSEAAGKNVLINGGFDIWQRGTSSTTQSGYVAPDRWYLFAGNTVTWARESTIVPAGSQYALKVTAGATIQPILHQAIETANAINYAGKNVTFSIYAQASTSTGISIDVQHSSSTDVSPTGSWTTITATSGGSGTAGTSGFTRISGVFAVPSTAKSLMVRIFSSSTIVNGVSLYFGQAQLELGSVPTTFSRAGGTLQGELAACQRYYFRTQPAASTRYIAGMAKTTTTTDFVYPYPVTMRTSPTALEQSGTAGDYGVLYQATGAVCSAVPVIVAASNAAITITFTVASGLTAGNATIPYAVNATGYLGWSAEL